MSWRNALKQLISRHGVWVSSGAGVSVQISLRVHKTERLCSCGVVYPLKSSGDLVVEGSASTSIE